LHKVGNVSSPGGRRELLEPVHAHLELVHELASLGAVAAHDPVRGRGVELEVEPGEGGLKLNEVGDFGVRGGFAGEGGEVGLLVVLVEDLAEEIAAGEVLRYTQYTCVSKGPRECTGVCNTHVCNTHCERTCSM